VNLTTALNQISSPADDQAARQYLAGYSSLDAFHAINSLPRRSTAPLPTDGEILKNYFNDPRYQSIQRAEDDAYTVQSSQYLIQQGTVGQATVAQLALTGHDLYGGFVPGVGEYQDAEAFLGRSSTLTERSVAGASLGLNILTAGAAPNFGGAGRVLRTETHYLDEVLDAQRFTHQIDVGSFDNAIISQYDTLAPSRAPTGQVHHPISKPVFKALEEHPNLAGQYQPRDPRFTTQASSVPTLVE
jgi:hypothetical protein